MVNGVVVAFCLVRIVLSTTVCSGHFLVSQPCCVMAQTVSCPSTPAAAPLHYRMYRIKPDLEKPEPVPLTCDRIVASTPFGKRCYSLGPVNEALKTKNKLFEQFDILATAEKYVAHAAMMAAGVDRADAAGMAAAAAGHVDVLVPKVWTNIQPVDMLPRRD